jgi:hypothetical protein
MIGEIVWDQNTFAVIGVFAVPIVAISGYYWHLVDRHRCDAELKHRMIERGMSADEIERILRAGPRKPGVWGAIDDVMDRVRK